jgi:hypothetical protein
MATSPWRRKPVRLGSGPSAWEHEILLGLPRGSGVSRWLGLFLDHGHGRPFQQLSPLHRQRPDVCQRPAGDGGDGAHVNGARDAVAQIDRGGWTFVVLQQGPMPAGICRDTLVIAAMRLAPRIRAADARTALFLPWSRRQFPAGDPACGSDSLRQIVRAGCASHTSRVAGRPPRGAAHGRPDARARGRGPRGQRELAGRFTHSGSRRHHQALRRRRSLLMNWRLVAQPLRPINAPNATPTAAPMPVPTAILSNTTRARCRSRLRRRSTEGRKVDVR